MDMVRMKWGWYCFIGALGAAAAMTLGFVAGFEYAAEQCRIAMFWLK